MQKHFLTIVLVSVLAVLFAFGEAKGETYYVDPSGSDEIGDGSLGNPWCTIQHSADHVVTGDTVIINPGTYEGGIEVTSTGTISEPITFRGAGINTVISGNGGKRDVFRISSANYIVLEGLHIQNADQYGLAITLSNHVVVRNCSFADNGNSGVLVAFSDYTLIEGCLSHGAIEGNGIYISSSSDFTIIRKNRIHHNRYCGLNMNGDAANGGDGIISFSQIDSNVIYENGLTGGSAINMDGVTNTFVRNNLLYENHSKNISLYQIDGGSGSQNNWILNNTIIGAIDGRWAIDISFSTNETGNKIYNNIILNYHVYRGGILINESNRTGFESDHNVVIDRFSIDGGDTIIPLNEWQSLGYDSHSIIATSEQLFVNPMHADFHLVSHSPGIDAGNNTIAYLPEKDLDNNERRVDDLMTVDTGSGTPPIIDIGADEYISDAPCIGDANGDRDVDGKDLSQEINAGGTNLDQFALDYGRIDCCPLLEVLNVQALGQTSAIVDFNIQPDCSSIYDAETQFIFNNGLVASEALCNNDSTVVITTSTQNHVIYTFTASNVIGICGPTLNPIASTVDFVGFGFE